MDSTLILALIIMAVTFTIIGVMSKGLKIFNLFSSAVLLVLIIELQNYVALVIMFVGLMLFQIWWAVFGGENI